MTISLKEWKFPRQYENVLLMYFFTVYIGAFLNWRYLDHPLTPVYLILLNFPASRLLAPSIRHYAPTYSRPKGNERANVISRSHGCLVYVVCPLVSIINN